jgi:hypothetical protein
MQITDAECMLLMQNGQDRRYAAQQINLANQEIRRLRSLLAHAEAELEDERAARLLAEYQLNKRH